MSEKPTYRQLEERVQILEKLISDFVAGEPKPSPSTITDSLALEKDYDTSMLELKNIIDVKAVQSLMEGFYRVTNIGVAILDLHGKVLVSTGWQDICTKFHRVHPETVRNCRESDLELSKDVETGTFRLYRCKNNMWDTATPIMVGDRKVGNLHLGQFLFEDEAPDVETFRMQAQTYGFDEKAYLNALENVPRWNRETVNSVMKFYTRFASLISDLSYKNALLNRTVLEKNNLIHSLEKSEETQRETAERLRLALECAHEGIWEWNFETGLVAFDEIALKMLNYEPDMLPRESEWWFDQIHPEDRPQMEEAFEKYLAGESDRYRMEFRIKRKDDQFIWVASNASIIRHADDGKPLLVVGIHRNITDRKEAEEALKERESFFSQQFEQSTTSMCLYNPDGTVNRTNKEFCRMFGVSEDAIIDSGYNVLENPATLEAGVMPHLNDIFFQKESIDHSASLFTHTCYVHGVDPEGLVLHSDNGGPMKGSTMQATLLKLGVIPSFSRPMVSDDKPIL